MKQTQLTTQLKAKTIVLLREYWMFCAATVIIVLIMNYFSRTNDSDMLKWILAPTARWASILGGMYFEYLPHQGYVNYFYQFVIAPSCAGSRFMLLTFLMLVSFRLPAFWSGDRKRKMQKEYLWFGFCIAFSYLATIFVNGIRIVVSVYLPDIVEKRHLMSGWLTSGRLHTLIGTGTYFTFLCLIYLTAARIHGQIFGRMERIFLLPDSTPECFTEHKKLIVPVFWYLLIVLAIPLIKRMYHNDWKGFGQYAAVIVGVCGSIYLLFMIVWKVRRMYNIAKSKTTNNSEKESINVYGEWKNQDC